MSCLGYWGNDLTAEVVEVGCCDKYMYTWEALHGMHAALIFLHVYRLEYHYKCWYYCLTTNERIKRFILLERTPFCLIASDFEFHIHFYKWCVI